MPHVPDPPRDPSAHLEYARSVLASDNVERVETGWDSVVFLIESGTYVLKIARTPASLPGLNIEWQALFHFNAQHPPLAIPRPITSSPDGRARLLHGVVGTPITQRPWSHRRQPELASAIGKLCAWLHTRCAPTDSTIPTAAPESYLERFEHSLTTGRVNDYLTAPVARQIYTIARERLLPAITNPSVPRVLSHGDLGMWNVLQDNAGGYGVVDFADLCHADPARDFAGLDHSVVDRALATYQEHLPTPFTATEATWLKHRVLIWRTLVAMSDMDFYLETADQPAAHDARQTLQQTVAHFTKNGTKSVIQTRPNTSRQR